MRKIFDFLRVKIDEETADSSHKAKSPKNSCFPQTGKALFCGYKIDNDDKS